MIELAELLLANEKKNKLRKKKKKETWWVGADFRKVGEVSSFALPSYSRGKQAVGWLALPA